MCFGEGRKLKQLKNKQNHVGKIQTCRKATVQIQARAYEMLKFDAESSGGAPTSTRLVTNNLISIYCEILNSMFILFIVKRIRFGFHWCLSSWGPLVQTSSIRYQLLKKKLQVRWTLHQINYYTFHLAGSEMHLVKVPIWGLFAELNLSDSLPFLCVHLRINNRIFRWSLVLTGSQVNLESILPVLVCTACLAALFWTNCNFYISFFLAEQKKQYLRWVNKYNKKNMYITMSITSGWM